MQATLTKVTRYSTNKEGNQLKTKDGRPYTSVRIKTQEHGDKWVSGFENDETKKWKEGDIVEIEVIPKGEYLNFRLPKKEDLMDLKLEMVLNKIVGLKIELAGISAKLDRLLIAGGQQIQAKSSYPTPQDEGIDINDTFPDEDDIESV